MSSFKEQLVSGYENSRGPVDFLGKILRFIRLTSFSFLESITFKLSRSKSSRIVSDMATARREGARFGGWALTETALYAFANAVEDLGEGVMEFGGGQSTLYWDVVARTNDSLRVSTWENDARWYDYLKSEITSDRISINRRYLRAVTDEMRSELFSQATESGARFSGLGTELTADGYSTQDIEGMIAFYDLSVEDIESLSAFKHMVLDGPHGDGRALAFCLLFGSLGRGSIVLIDDYRGYRSLEFLERLFEYDVIDKSERFAKSWIVVRITDASPKT